MLGIAGAAAVGLAALPGVAHAEPAGAMTVAHIATASSRAITAPTSGNAGTDLLALSAYRAYLTALSADAESSADRDSIIVDGVASTCAGALDDLNDLSAAQLKTSALTDFADEVDADLDLAYMAATRPALNVLAATLTGLQWSTTTQSEATTRLISTERTLLRTAQPDVCDDATTLDAAPLSEPTTTATFLTRYRHAAQNLHAAVKAFQALLGKYETKSEMRLVSEINTLVAEFSSASGAVESSDASTVLSELGISSS